MTKFENLSPQDRKVMEVLWEHGDMNNSEILKELGKESWTRHTVRAYLLRLMDKELVKVTKISRKSQYYSPTIGKEEYLASETAAYLEERYNGLVHMVSGLAIGNKVTDEELDELEQFLKEFRK